MLPLWCVSPADAWCVDCIVGTLEEPGGGKFMYGCTSPLTAGGEVGNMVWNSDGLSYVCPFDRSTNTL